MKFLLISLLMMLSVQGAKAAPQVLSESQSKKLYKILATYGLRMDFPMEKQTREWTKLITCERQATGTITELCQVQDDYHGGAVTKTGPQTRTLYNFLANYVTAPSCIGGSCQIDTPEIKCTYLWPDKIYPRPRRYICSISRTTGLN